MLRRSRAVIALLVGSSVLPALATPSARAGEVVLPQVVSADPIDTTPHVKDGKILSLLPLGNRIYIGGTFTQVRNAGESTIQTKKGLFAIEKDAQGTWKIVPSFTQDFEVTPGGGFDPVSGEELGESPRGVQAVAASEDGRYLFVGGDWGAGGRKLVKLDATSGLRIPTWNSGIASAVKDVVVSKGRVFAAGVFQDVEYPNGSGTKVPRGGLAAFDVESGALLDDVAVPFTEPIKPASDPLNPNTGRSRVESIAISADGKTLVAGGNFKTVNGVSGSHWQMALLDVTPGEDAEVINWQTDRYNPNATTDGKPACAEKFDSHIKDLDMAPDGSYFVVVTTGGYTSRGPLCDTVARWETSARGAGLQPTWATFDGGDTFTGVTIAGAAIYVSGHLRWLNNFDNAGSSTDAMPGPGSVEREGIAALDPVSGMALPWNPRRERGHGAEALVATAEGLWVGSDTDFIGHRGFDGLADDRVTPQRGELHEKLSFFPLAGGAPVYQTAMQGLPGDLYSVGSAGLSKRFFDGTALGTATTVGNNWSSVRGAFAAGGKLYVGQSDGKMLRYPFDGVTIGAPQEVPLRSMTSTHFDVKRMTGMFYANGRLYYTKSGSSKLYWRSFLPQVNVTDDIVGDREMDAGGAAVFGSVAGLTQAGGYIYYADGGNLKRIRFENGTATGSASTVKSAAGLDGAGLFLMPQTTQAPPASLDPPPPAPPIVTPPVTGNPSGGGGTTVRRSGYWMVDAAGKVYPFGDARSYGEAAAYLGAANAVDLEPTVGLNGYWVVDDIGRVFGFGDAAHYGNVDGARLVAGEKVTALSATPSGKGYWIFTSKGRVLAFGDAGHFGDVSAMRLNGPVLDSIATRSGKGYYMVASDGGIFAFGDAAFLGSLGSMKLNAPVQSLVPTADGRGYWLVASDGGVFAFGNAPFRGSTGSMRLNKPMTGMVPFGNGYLMVGEDGGIFNFSDKDFLGSLGARPPARPVVSVAALDG